MSFPLWHSDGCRALFALGASECNALLDFIDRVRNQLSGGIGMSALVLRDTIQMSLGPFQRVERALHIRLGSDRKTSAEADRGGDEGDRQHFSGGLVEKAHASFL